MIRRSISRARSRVSTAKARVSTATAKGKTTLGKLITSAKQPAVRLGNTIGQSTKLAEQFSRKAIPKIRMGKILGNVPATFSKWKVPTFKVPKLPSMAFPKLPKVRLPKLPDPIGFIRGINLKSKIPKLGFPKFPKLPDFPGFFKEKVGDVRDSIEGIVEKTMGAAGDWKAKRDQKKLIFKIVVGIILVFLGAILWKKK